MNINEDIITVKNVPARRKFHGRNRKDEVGFNLSERRRLLRLKHGLNEGNNIERTVIIRYQPSLRL